MSTMKNIEDRIVEVAENDAKQIDFPMGKNRTAVALGIPADELTEDLYDSYVSAFWRNAVVNGRDS